MRKYFEFYSGVKIKCGEAALLTVAEELAAFRCKKPFLLSSLSAEKMGLTDKVKAAIPADAVKEVIVYSAAPVKLDADVVKEIKKVYLSKECDGVIAVGGESVMDSAKCLRLFLSQECDEILPIMGTAVNKKDLVPMIVIPTENGSGTEASGILEVEDNYVTSSAIVPDVVIIDEDTAMATNAKSVAECGGYALANAVEAYLSSEEEDPSTVYAEKAIKLLSKYLVKAVKDGDDEEACRGTSLACTYAGIAYGNAPFGAAHALAQGIDQVTEESEAAAYSMTLVPAMKKAKENAEERLKTILFLTKGANEYAETPDSERADAAIRAIAEIFVALREIAHVNTKISQTKIMRECFGAVAEAAANKRAAITAFSPITRDEFIALLNEAY